MSPEEYKRKSSPRVHFKKPEKNKTNGWCDMAVLIGTIVMTIVIGWFALNSGWSH